MDPVKTRFAPSPTGHLHVGSARTALFNYLLARRTGGRFLLRIEDTDRERHVEGADRQVQQDLRWLGLVWDEGVSVGGPAGPYVQSERLDLYRRHAQQLVDAGRAYYAFETAEELDTLRAAAEAKKQSFRYARPAALPSKADADRARAEGRPVVVRFAAPGHDVTIHDEVFGDVTVTGEQQEDFVILKSDGFPTYHLANVVDDALMGTTFIMRGQEFLGQTWRQTLLREAFGFPEPRYAHLPIILNPDGTKMSKRDKHKIPRRRIGELIRQGKWTAQDVARVAACTDEVAQRWLDGSDAELDVPQVAHLAASAGAQVPEIDLSEFRRSGYLPEALVNFIALLGWSPGADREKFTLAELEAAFSVDRLGKANAKFDRDKLLAFNTDAVAAATQERLLEAFRDFLSLNDTPIPPDDEAVLRRLLDIHKGFRTFADIVHKAGFLFQSDEAIRYDPKAVKDVLDKGGGAGWTMLAELRPLLADAQWTAEVLEAMLSGVCQAKAVGMGKVAQPLRVAVSGSTVSPPIYDTLTILGKERTLARIDRCLAARRYD